MYNVSIESAIFARGFVLMERQSQYRDQYAKLLYVGTARR